MASKQKHLARAIRKAALTKAVSKLSKFFKPLLLAIFLGAFLSFQNLDAKVLHSDKGGFIIESSAQTHVSSEIAYQQFIHVERWWDPDHSWFGEASNFSLEPKAGGCFCEIDGERQVMHLQVVFVEPNKEIRLIGGLGPLQAMGLSGTMSWTFTESDQGGTEIVHRYSVNGFHPDGLGFLAPIVDKVQTAQLARLIDSLKTAE